MFAFSSNQYPAKIALIIQFFNFIEPLQAAFQTILVRCVVHHHDQIRIFAKSQSHRLVELVAAQIKQKEFNTHVFLGKRDKFRMYFCSLGLDNPESTIL